MNNEEDNALLPWERGSEPSRRTTPKLNNLEVYFHHIFNDRFSSEEGRLICRLYADYPRIDGEGGWSGPEAMIDVSLENQGAPLVWRTWSGEIWSDPPAAEIERVEAEVRRQVGKLLERLQVAAEKVLHRTGSVQYDFVVARTSQLRFYAMRIFYAVQTGKPVPPDAFSNLISEAQYIRQTITQALAEYSGEKYSSLRTAMEQLRDALPAEVSADSLAEFIGSFEDQYREFSQHVESFWLDVWASGTPEPDEGEIEA